MRNRMVCFWLFLAVVCWAGVAKAGAWQTVYSTDFSTNPNWATNAPSRYYCDSNTQVQAYSVNAINIFPGTGGAYGVHDVGTYSGSFRLTWDINAASIDWAGQLNFGMWGADLESYNYGSYARFAFVHGDTGYFPQMDTYNISNAHGGVTDYQTPFSLNTWYRVQMTYDSAAGTLSAVTTVRDTGQTFSTMSISNVGPFSADMTFLGSADMKHLPGGNPLYGGAQAHGMFDNVTFQTPEPATLSMLALGGLAVLRRWRK